jgi:predicted ester cyclase
LERLREQVAAFRTAVPDACWTIVAQVAEGETVVTRLSVRGTFSGPLLRLAPPGRLATLTGVVIVNFAAGRVVDLWLQADLLGLLQQLGVMPPLDLTQAVIVAQVLYAGTLPDGRSGL